MDTFEQAIQIENEYLSLRMNPILKNNFNFKNKIESLGFTLESFYEEKKIRFFKNKNIIVKEINETLIEKSVQDAFINKQDTFIIIYSEEPVVYVPKDEILYNKQYCEDNNLFVVEIGYNGGTIISSEYDITLGLVLQNSQYMTSFLLSKLSQFLKTKNINNIIEENDILIDGYKIIGSAQKTIGDMTLHCFQISFVTNNDLINNISTKSPNKIPKGISEFTNNITRDNIKNEVLGWLQ
jgi:lipoate-protein ligase A